MDYIKKPMRVSIEMEGATEIQEKVIRKAIEKLLWAINHESFRKFIRDYTQLDGTQMFKQTKHSNEWHLKRFVEGNERLKAKKGDFEMDLDIKFYFKNNKVIGYTRKGSIEINLNTKYLYRQVPSIVNTLVHEYCHLVGMTHSYRNPGWDFWLQTAPYAIGLKAEEMVSRLLGVQSPVTPDAYKPSLWTRFKRIFI